MARENDGFAQSWKSLFDKWPMIRFSLGGLLFLKPSACFSKQVSRCLPNLGAISSSEPSKNICLFLAWQGSAFVFTGRRETKKKKKKKKMMMMKNENKNVSQASVEERTLLLLTTPHVG